MITLNKNMATTEVDRTLVVATFYNFLLSLAIFSTQLINTEPTPPINYRDENKNNQYGQ